MSIVKDGELPNTWGLIVANAKEDGLAVETKAPRLQPAPLDKHIVAAIARRACEQSADAEEIEAAKNAGIEAGRKERFWEMKELIELRQRVADFTKATGIGLDPSEYMSRFHYHEATKIGEAVLMALKNQDEYERQVEVMRNAANRVLEIIGDKQPEDRFGKKRRRRVNGGVS